MCHLPVLAVILAASICFGSPAERAHSLQRRVVGGQEYQRGEFPFHVSLWYGQGYKKSATWLTYKTPNLMHFCGGSLIESQWVLTNAFCVIDGYQVGAKDLSLVKIAVGMHSQTSAEKEAQFRTISAHFTPPDLDWEEAWGNIALIKLDSPVDLSSQSVGLATLNGDPNCPNVGQTVDMIGWGQAKDDTSLYGYGSDIPQKTALEVFDLKSCNETYYGWLAEGQMCAGTNGDRPKGACWGDYGSPLVVSCGQSKPRVVAGIYSYGLGCGNPGESGVFTEVSHYKSWIDQTILENS